MRAEEIVVEDNDNAEIPALLLPRLITWLRVYGMKDSDIVNCISYVCGEGKSND